MVVELQKYGIVFARNSHLWVSDDKLLNYELQSGLNCKNLIATEDEVKSYEALKEKEEADRKAKEEEQKRK